ncbi:MAG: hypothetical protein ABIR15_07680 [Chitinophagaceae bacterium]
MKQIFAVVITIAIVFILTCRFIKNIRPVHNGYRQPASTEKRPETDLDFPASAGGLLIRHLLY